MTTLDPPRDVTTEAPGGQGGVRVPAVVTREDVRRDAEIRRRELAGFLRSRRERIAPEQVGVPAAGRRRTPGLRREEVAQLAGVGVTWYTWLEQGRDINPSSQVLEALARTLLLDPHERSHLLTLAGTTGHAPSDESYVVSPAIRDLLRQVEPYPASVQNARYDVLAYNHGYRLMVDDLDVLDPEDRNGLWLVFTHPAWRAALVDWDEAAARMAAQYRAAMAEHVSEPAWKCLVERLRKASPEFEAIWGRHEVMAPERMTKRVLSPRVGPLRMELTTLWLCQRLGTRVVFYTPADDATRERLEALGATEVAAPGGSAGQRGACATTTGPWYPSWET